jgi:hypothetical protein
MNALFAFFAAISFSSLPTLRKAIAAVHGTVAPGLERDLRGLAALAADRAEHLARTAAAAAPAATAAATESAPAATAAAAATPAARGLLRRAARGTTLGLVREPELSEALLLSRRERKLRSTIDARQRLVRVHG